MWNEHGEELESGDQLMVSAEGGVIVAPVEDASVLAVLQTLEGDGRALHVLKKTFELESLTPGNAAIARDARTRMPP